MRNQIAGFLQEMQKLKLSSGSSRPCYTLNAIDLNTGNYAWKIPLANIRSLSHRA